jgi:hypothetical protein
MPRMTLTVQQPVTRRRFGVVAGSALASVASGDGCLVATNPAAGTDVRLTARPRPGVATSLTSGPLGLGDGERDGVIQVPSAPADGGMLGYDVTFREFEGRHDVPPEIASEG